MLSTTYFKASSVCPTASQSPPLWNNSLCKFTNANKSKLPQLLVLLEQKRKAGSSSVTLKHASPINFNHNKNGSALSNMHTRTHTHAHTHAHTQSHPNLQHSNFTTGITDKQPFDKLHELHALTSASHLAQR